ncbi:glycoside hydrolase family 75 protein [Streptomyces sp. NBC_00878]|uniref:glycoside hydrolase family 75 protein n=1 Tax=Streptomyces sp. NBC_00878 TaxID=2975854 RepID=UPI002251CCB1|nr:glycoside hydrolase family 75 protein [Streptomyces sp. NBC_00878]MCX4904110.1 glycoside hydrolase family 75 protein [Streptomyces sp. NBC_00878]
MRTRTLTLAAAATGAALLAAAALPAGAAPVRAREGAVSAADLLAEVATCSQISRGRYSLDAAAPATVPVCGKSGAVFWKADMDIDCDGQVTTACNTRTDPWFQNQTSFRQSDGRPLNSEQLPYIVLPRASDIWKYANSGISGGSVAAVIYGDKVEYGVVGDTGPAEIIGEASYATARALGINPDPVTGGVRSGVTYIVFTDSKVSPIEDHSAAASLGEALAQEFLEDN